MPIKKEIFGKIFSVCGVEDGVYDTLARELALYPDAEGQDTDIEIVLGRFSAPTPATQIGMEVSAAECNVLHANYGFCDVKFVVNEIGQLRRILFQINRYGGVRRLAQRWLWYDYATVEERIGEIFSELVLVPSVVFDSERFLLHASAMERPGSQGAILLGGVGGVGKTSLELELCINRDYKFISDDIVPVSVDGVVYPNLCYPKIYGYNAPPKSALHKSLMEERRLLDKMHWFLRSRLLGASSVRRRVSCAELFAAHATKPVSLTSYYLILRAAVSSIQVETLPPSIAATSSIKVMETEYSTFFNQVLRHEYHVSLLKRRPALEKEAVMNRWTESVADTLSQIRNYVLLVPEHMKHGSFLDEASKIITRG